MTADDEVPTSSPPKAKPAVPRRTVRRRLMRLALVLVSLAIVLRVALPFALPPLLDSLVAGSGLTLQYEDLNLSLLTGEVQLWNLEVAKADAQSRGDRVAHVEYARVDLDVWSLLGGTLRLRRAEVDGVDLWLDTDEDGNIVLPFLETGAPEIPNAAPEGGGEGGGGAVTFTPPIRIDTARLQHLRLHLRDPGTTPPTDRWIEASLRLSDLGSDERPTRLHLQVHGPDLLDSLNLEGRATLETDRAEANFELRMEGLHPRNAATWLAPLGIEPHAEVLAAGFRVSLVARATPTPGDLHVAIELDQVRLTADGTEQVALDSASLQAQLHPGLIQFEDVTIDGLRGNATLRPDGGLRLAGFDLPSPNPAPANQVATETTPSSGDILQLDTLALSGLALRLRDERVSPSVDLELIGDLVRVSNLVTDPTGDQDATLELRARLPGIAETLQIDGQLNPFASTARVDVQLQADGLTLNRLAPYLNEAGWEETLDDGKLQMRVTGQLETRNSETLGSLAVENLRLTDEETLLAITHLGVRDLLAGNALTRLGAVEVHGLEVTLRRDEDGTLHALGLHHIETGVASEAARAIEAAAQTRSRQAHRFELGSLRLREVVMRFRDDILGSEYGPDSLEVDLRNFAFGGEPVPEASPTRAELDLRLRGAFADNLRATGSITTHPGPLDVAIALELEGSGMHLAPLTPYLRSVGIEPGFREGRMKATLAAEARLDADGKLAFSTAITELTLADSQGSNLLSLGALRIRGGTVHADGFRAEEVALEAPMLRAVRGADGRLTLAGLVLAPVSDAGTSENEPTEPPPSPAITPGADPTVGVGRLGLEQGVIEWRDETVNPPVNLRLAVSAGAEGLTTGVGAPSASVQVTLGIDGVLAAGRIEGEITLDPSDFRGDLVVDLRGLQAGPLAPYLPPGVASNLSDGRLHGEIRARLGLSPEGGRALDLVAENVSLRDGEGGDPLLQWDQLQILAPRVDPAGRWYQIERATVQGLELTATQDASGAFSLLGLTIHTPPEDMPAEFQPEAGTQTAEAEQPGTPPEPPRIAIETLDLELRRLSFTAAGGTRALELALHLTNPSPLVLMDRQPAGLDPLRLHLDGAATPLAGQIDLDVEVLPWSAEARLDVDLDVRGLDGRALPDVLPLLAQTLRADGIEDGQLTAHLTATAALPRRHATDLDLSRGFGLEIGIENLALRESTGGPVLAGIDSLILDAPRITPDKAHVTNIYVDDLHGRLWRDETGLHLAGLTLTQQTPAPEPGEEGTQQPPAEQPVSRQSEGAAPSLPEQSTSRPFEVFIERLSASGLDFEYRNTLSDPPLVLPLTGLELEVEDFSTRALTQRIPFRFNLALEAGAVALPVRAESGGLIRGVVSAAGSMVGARGEVVMTERLFMEELSVQGRLALYPHVEGRIRTSLTGLELTALLGPAAESGVVIGDGVLDAGVDMRFEGEDGVYTDARLTFMHLALEEGSDGPISTYLRLPAPLNTVLFVLKNDQDEIVIPLSFRTSSDGIAPEAINREAVRAFGSLVTDAIASSPFRVTGAVTTTLSNTLGTIGSLFGIGGNAEPKVDLPPVTVEFPPGDPALTTADRKSLEAIAGLLKGDVNLAVVLTHEFGPADMERAAILANPTVDQTLDLVARLRQRRAELTRDRAARAAELRADHAVGRLQAADRGTRQLQALDQELGETEDALDQILQLLRPSADRRKDQRTRTTAVAIGTQRLEAVRQYLIDLCGAPYADRIELRRARLRMVPTEDPQQTPLGRVIATPKRRRL